MKSVMTHSFSQAPSVQAPRSKFNRSHGHKFSMNCGWLVPFYWDDVLPGDTFNYNLNAFARMTTPYNPIMDNMFLDTHFFFVPYRLIWDNSKKFFGEQVDPGDSIDYTIPILEGANSSDCDADLSTTVGRRAALMDYLGCPDGLVPDTTDVSALPFRAYNRIYAEWFRDQNLIDSPPLIKDDGPDDMEATGEHALLQRRGKRHDYFTSMLPWPQKGNAVSLPLGTKAYVHAPGGHNIELTYRDDAASGSSRHMYIPVTNLAGNNTGGGTNELYANLNTATAATVNELREAFQVQKLLERDARGGTRYSELVKNHFGVDFYDVSYRPEYLGGGSSPVNINPIVQTAQNDIVGANGIAGKLGAFATSSVNGHGFTKSFVEHGIVMGIMSIRADLTYQQGLRRELSKSTRYDIYWPSLAHLGEQTVLKKEAFHDGSANDDNVLGYQERYAEYRYKPSQISGVLKSAATSSLDPWHLSQEFDATLALNQAFIEENPPMNRVLIATNEPHFIVDTYANLTCARPMPTFGVPGLIDHF